MRELRTEQVEDAIQALPELPRAVLRRLLAPRREERFATGAELARVLRDHVWSKGWRYGRPELVAEVAALEGPVPGDLEDSGDEARRGRGEGRSARVGGL
ncbi:hypothetical protein ACN28S_14740 [Cystobacter fuscus]